MIYDAPMLQAWTCAGWHRHRAGSAVRAYRLRTTGLPRRLRHLATDSVYHRYFGWRLTRR